MTIKGDCNLDRSGVPGRLLQPPGTRAQALANQPEVTVFQISQSAMQQFGRRAAGRTHRVVTLEQNDVVTLLKQGPRAHDAVNTGADNGQSQSTARIRSLQKKRRRAACFKPATSPLFHHRAAVRQGAGSKNRTMRNGAGAVLTLWCRKRRTNNSASCDCTPKPRGYSAYHILA